MGLADQPNPEADKFGKKLDKLKELTLLASNSRGQSKDRINLLIHAMRAYIDSIRMEYPVYKSVEEFMTKDQFQEFNDAVDSLERLTDQMESINF